MSEPAPRLRRHNTRKWHRWLGLIAALPLLWLSLSGILLNHAEFFGLNDRQVSAGWVLKRYHQLPEGEPRGITIGDRKVAFWDGLTFLDKEFLEIPGQLVGAVALKNQLIIATDERIAILDGTGEMVLDLDELSLPPLPIETVTVDKERLFVFSGKSFWRFSEDFLSFEETSTHKVFKSLPLLDDADRESLSNAIMTRRAMPLSRVILDAHSGKLFGWPGWLLTDLAAASVIVLTILGLGLFKKRQA
ncbi:PepSY domain-containing protein [Akkermansiaceae bacterium]|nr:PepSY domain-containing protein [Akkermansiaceae bacterium]